MDELQGATMNDIASWLRAQFPSSTDPDRFERLAREAERQAMMRSSMATKVRERAPVGSQVTKSLAKLVGFERTRRAKTDGSHQASLFRPAIGRLAPNRTTAARPAPDYPRASPLPITLVQVLRILREDA